MSHQFGNLQSPRLKKQHILREDNRADLVRQCLSQFMGITKWLQMFKDVASFKMEKVTMEGLQEQGYNVKVRNKESLSSTEEECIKKSLMELAVSGSTAMGKYKKVCRSSRTHPQVGV